LCASPHADTCSVLSPGHLPHNDGSLRSPPPPPRMGLNSPSKWDNACSLRLALSVVGIQPEEGE
jgi:hypothetical protein